MKFTITEEERSSIRGMYLMEQITGNTQNTQVSGGTQPNQVSGGTQPKEYKITMASFDTQPFVKMSDLKKYGRSGIVFNGSCKTNKMVKDPRTGIKGPPIYYSNQELPKGCVVGIKMLNIDCDQLGCKPTDRYKSPSNITPYKS
jgi:hypothetical protein